MGEYAKGRAVMDAGNEKILEHLVGAGVLSKEDQETVRAAADVAARGAGGSEANKVVCNTNYCLVVKEN
jgi:hypothetical protein